ncbi:MAG: DNA recombination protein RmuC [Pseudomonadota bacterium]
MQTFITIGDISLDLLHVLFLCAALGAATFAWMFRNAAAQRDAFAEELVGARAETETAKLQLAELKGQQQRDSEQFGELAQVVLQRTQSQFLQLANETFEKHKESTKGDLKALMGPIGENFNEFKKRVTEIEKVRAEDKSAIQEQVKAIGESLHRNTQETGKLVNALTAPKGGGRWGEMTLRNVMEQSGLSSYCDFDEQVTDHTEEGRQRPDAVIYLPGGRQIVVDSKVSLEAYMQASSAEDAAQRAVALKAHASQVQRHIDMLASKGYQNNLDERVDFVAMFIPGENFFAAALQHAPDLLDRAYARNVIVTTPSTLIGLAKTVAYVWRQEKMTEHAREAATLGQELYRRIAVMADHIGRLGKSLNASVDNFNKMNSSFDKRVLPTLRRFDELSIAAPDKQVETTKLLESRADIAAE